MKTVLVHNLPSGNQNETYASGKSKVRFMEIGQITNQLLRSGFSKAIVNGKHVEVALKNKNGEAYAVVLVDCSYFPGMSVESYENMLRGIRSSLYQYNFNEVHLLSVLCTETPQDVKELVAGFGEHWVIDAKERKLLIYENQIVSFLDVKEIIEEALLYGSAQMAEDIRKIQQNRKIFKENWCTYGLVIVNVIVFLVLSLYGDTENGYFMEQHGAMSLGLVGQGLWEYRLFTSIFMHFGISHLLNNMFTLIIMGMYVEKRMSKWKYLTIYFGAGIIGNLVSLYYYISTNQMNVVCAGASGAVFGLMGALLWIVICNYGRLEELSWMHITFLILLCVYIGFSDSSVGNAAHIGGVIGGFLLAMFLVRRTDKEEMV